MSRHEPWFMMRNLKDAVFIMRHTPDPNPFPHFRLFRRSHR